ncbi:MAG TPA: DUF2304 domain-containing protein [Kofleriaceae bacterium]|nr:DUF2304 domain-containing protein [Kofleriaceae bacterium]
MKPDDLWFEGGTLVFAGVCLVIALVLIRLLLRERVSLQGSMSYLAFLVVLGSMAVFPNGALAVANYLGFTLLSNFFFVTAIAALAILHLRSLVTLSKVHLRTVALTQELALLQEKLEHVAERTNASVSLSAAAPDVRSP